MKFKDKFRFVQKNMKKNKTRVFMTVLAAAMGCAFLIVLASVGFGLQKSVVDQITQGRLLTDISIFGKETKNGVTAISEADIPYLESVKNVKAVTRRQTVNQPLKYRLGDLQTEQFSTVVHMPSEVKAGFELSEGVMPQSDNEIVVGYYFADSLRSEKDPNAEAQGTAGQKPAAEGGGAAKPPKPNVLGQTVTIEAAQYFGKEKKTETFTAKIVGIGKKPSREWNHDQNAYLSEGMLAQIEAFTGTTGGILNDPNLEKKAQKKIREVRNYEVHVYAQGVEDVEGIAKEIRAKGFMNHSIVNELEQVNVVFLIMKIGLLFVGTIAVIIASIGIFNTMTMAVTERSQDIGIMKAIGAHPKAIKSIFLIESTYIGLLGAIIGTVVSYIISYVVNFALPIVIQQFMDRNAPDGLQFSYIPLSLTLISTAICLAVAIISGVRPAIRATQVDVLKALRRDV